MSDAVNITEEQMPILRPIPFEPGQDHRHWRFMSTWHYLIHVGKFKGMTIQVPAGKVVNGASIPKLFSNTFASTGILFIGACIHDPGYESGGLIFLDSHNTPKFMQMGRSELDDLFIDISHYHYPEHPIAIGTAGALLSAGGGEAWDDCRRKDGTYIKPVDKSGEYDKDWNIF